MTVNVIPLPFPLPFPLIRTSGKSLPAPLIPKADDFPHALYPMTSPVFLPSPYKRQTIFQLLILGLPSDNSFPHNSSNPMASGGSHTGLSLLNHCKSCYVMLSQCIRPTLLLRFIPTTQG